MCVWVRTCVRACMHVLDIVPHRCIEQCCNICKMTLGTDFKDCRCLTGCRTVELLWIVLGMVEINHTDN